MVDVVQLTDVIAFNVRIERARRRWNQGQLGDLIGLSRSGISELEAGRRRPGVDDLAPLCRAFGVNLARLLEGAEATDLAALGLLPPEPADHTLPITGRNRPPM
jgi:transcriptional regulator with XRE-family HTH domain